MDNAKKILKELEKQIDICEAEKSKFFSGILSQKNEETLINFVENLHKNQDKIPDEAIYKKAKKLVDSILKHKNYKIFLHEKAKRQILEEKEIIKQQKQAEIKNKTTLLVSKIEKCLINDDIDSAHELFRRYKKILARYENEFYIKYNDDSGFRENIRDIINKRKIRNLVHFTNIENLESILMNGILSVDDLKEEKLNFKNNDMDRQDGKLNCSCFSVEYPNTFLFDKFRNNNTWCVIVLDIEKVLLNNQNIKYFTYCNAARSDARYNLGIGNLCNSRHFENMFICINPNYNHNYNRNEKKIKSYLPTDAQAEILVSGRVKTTCIKEVHLLNIDDFKKICINKQLLDNFSFVESEFYFKSSRDDINWEDR